MFQRNFKELEIDFKMKQRKIENQSNFSPTLKYNKALLFQSLLEVFIVGRRHKNEMTVKRETESLFIRIIINIPPSDNSASFKFFSLFVSNCLLILFLTFAFMIFF